MNSFLSDVKDTLLPNRDAKDGPLPPMLIVMTLVTGLVDAFSYLVLGHVFVANMTGNVVFIAFALAGAKGFSIPSSLLALGSFIAGTVGAGRIVSRMNLNRGRLLSSITGIQSIFLAVGFLLSLVSRSHISSYYAYGLIIALRVSMGMQNSAARKLAVPDLTTTVLTLTITGIGEDARFIGGSGSKAGRRLTAVFAMFFGALLGSLLILYSSLVFPILFAFSLISVVALLTGVFSDQKSSWFHSKWMEHPGGK
jgi:uncharacterized membrane protein YoaK (UPF0700 family)